MSTDSEFFLEGMSFTVGGEVLPARKVYWARFAPCGCMCGVSMMTEDTITEKQAWTEFSGNARMVKRDKELGYTMRMMAKPIPKDFGECTHSPKWGVEPVPTPPGYAWAAETFSRGASSLHLVPLTPLDEDEAKAQNSEWAEPGDRKVASVCDRRSQSVWGWSRRWHRTEGKLECATCLKLARAQTLPGMGGAV